MIENEGVDLAIVAYNYKFIEENKETQLFIKKTKLILKSKVLRRP